MSYLSSKYRAAKALVIMAMLMAFAAVPAMAQADPVGDLGDTLVTKAGTALVAGFAVAVVILGGIVGYRLIKRFLS